MEAHNGRQSPSFDNQNLRRKDKKQNTEALEKECLRYYFYNKFAEFVCYLKRPLLHKGFRHFKKL
jgi:hypothetical protein